MDSQLHLTDEQFTELLLGTEDASVQAHLQVCSQCADEAARVTGAIGDFNKQSMLWAERRATTHAAVSTGQPRMLSWVHRPQAWTAAGLAVAVALGAAVSVHRTRESVTTARIGVSQSATRISPATLKSDNDLLSAIDGELRADESTTASTYRLGSASHADRTKATKRATSE